MGWTHTCLSSLTRMGSAYRYRGLCQLTLVVSMPTPLELSRPSGANDGRAACRVYASYPPGEALRSPTSILCHGPFA